MIKLWTPRGYFVTPRCTLAGQIKRAFFLETRGASLGGRARHRRGLESPACSASDDPGWVSSSGRRRPVSMLSIPTTGRTR
jgi:hypothetical protein